MLTLTINGQKRQAASPPETPVHYVLRDELDIMSAKFGCGLASAGRARCSSTVWKPDRASRG